MVFFENNILLAKLFFVDTLPHTDQTPYLLNKQYRIIFSWLIENVEESPQCAFAAHGSQYFVLRIIYSLHDVGLRSLEEKHLIQPHENSLATLWITGRKREPPNLTLSASKITFQMISRGYMWILNIVLLKFTPLTAFYRIEPDV